MKCKLFVRIGEFGEAGRLVLPVTFSNMDDTPKIFNASSLIVAAASMVSASIIRVSRS